MFKADIIQDAKTPYKQGNIYCYSIVEVHSKAGIQWSLNTYFKFTPSKA